jgi:chemotaxis protein histidine kinase CheA
MTMSNPVNPQELQVTQTPVEPQERTPLPDDRILTPEETENLFVGKPIDAEPLPDTADADQQPMVDAFFGNMPTETGQVNPIQGPGDRPEEPQVTPQIQQQVDQQIQQQAPTPPAPVQQTPAESAMQAQMAQMQNELSGLRNYQAQVQQVQAQQQQQAQQTQQAQQQQQQQEFGFNVPDEYMNAINSEDPAQRKQALNQLLSATAQSIYARTTQEMNQRFAQIPNQMEPVLNAREYEQRIKQDMYGTYPELVGMEAQVAAVATQLQQQGVFPGGGWNENFRDAIAEKLSPMVPAIQQRIQQNRAARGIGVPPAPPPSNVLPPGVNPVGVVGGTHAQPQVGAQPALFRDAQGNLVQAQQQYGAVGPQTRPNGHSVDAQLQDIWNTLSY